MKFLVNSVSCENLKNTIRRMGYALIFDRKSGQESLSRRLSDGHYPRFHLYIEESGQNCIMSLHLDQKKASYEGQHMHSAEYDGELVEGEMESLKIFLMNNGYNISSFGQKQKNIKNENRNHTVSVKETEIKDQTSLREKTEIDVLSDIGVGDLERDLDNFQKNVKSKKFLSIF